MNKTLAATLIVALTSVGQVAWADNSKGGDMSALTALCQTNPKDDSKDKKEEWKREPKAEQSVTQHQVFIGGKPLDYTDFPPDGITLWFTNNTILLPSEY